jgi:hypothetical protein
MNSDVARLTPPFSVQFLVTAQISHTFQAKTGYWYISSSCGAGLDAQLTLPSPSPIVRARAPDTGPHLGIP